MLKQSQQLKLLQKISPQQIQFIKLLQIPTATLEARVKEELEANPALEDGVHSRSETDSQDDKYNTDKEEDNSSNDDFNLEDYLQSDSYSYKTKLPQGGGDEDDYEIPVVALESFYDSLKDQLGMLSMEEEERTLAEHLIGSIDEDGYLRRELRAIANDLAFRQNIRTTPEVLEAILLKIQNFDPAGIAARDLRECLLLQLREERTNRRSGVCHPFIGGLFRRIQQKAFQQIEKCFRDL